MRVAFTAGGTGGHIYPAIAVAEELCRQRADATVRFITGTRQVERAIIGDSGYAMDTISVIGLPRKQVQRLPLFAWKLAAATLASLRILKRFAPCCLLATGGYVSGPPVIAAYAMGIPVYLQEQNAFPGITTKKLASRARMLFLGNAAAAQHFGEGVKTMVTGNPVRPGIDAVSHDDGAEAFGLDPEKKTVLVFGGSQGARRINETVAEIAPALSEKGMQLIWQTGAAEYERWKSYRQFPGIVVRPYIDIMASAYAACDCAVTRAGAMTIAELGVCSVPAILIPLPTAAEHHQDYNARSVADAGAGILIRESALTPELLERTLNELLGSAERLASMKAASRTLGANDAAKSIAEYLLNQYSGN